MISQLPLNIQSERGYSIDTSSLVRYSVVIPISEDLSLWNSVSTLINKRRMFASVEVKNEIEDLVVRSTIDDELLNWCRNHPRLFVRHNNSILSAVKDILSEFPSFVNIQGHRNFADPYVIAIAQINGLTVITEEKKKTNRINIPTICEALEIPCIDMRQFLINEGIRSDL